MKMPLFRAAFKNQRISMWIYSSILLAYGLLIMIAFLQVEGTLSDPFHEYNGAKIIEVGDADIGSKEYNLSWDTEVGVSFHLVIGFEDLHDLDVLSFTPEASGDPDIGSIDITDHVMNETWINENGGHEIYRGGGRFVRFNNTYGAKDFIVVLVPIDGNVSFGDVNGPVSTEVLDVVSTFDEYLEDNAFMDAWFGGGELNFTEVDGFMVLEFFSLWGLFLTIYLALKAGSLISKHVEDRSMDILLATGYTRNRFLTEKNLILLVNLATINVFVWIGLFLGTILIGEQVPILGLSLTMLGYIPIAIGIMGLSMLLSVLIDEGSKATGAVMGLVIGQYVIQIVANIAKLQNSVGYLSLFRYVDSTELMIDHVIDPVNFFVPLAVGAVAIGLTYYLFNRKDIHA
ncbi:MAG: ABC transporter permease subunit [Candidatus Thermoplasmatota archaeon]|nr:ABC transporter permease subunit [Candidatus Thermoplasmatota archaeon]